MFVACLLIVLVIGLYRTFTSGFHPHPILAPPVLPRSVEAVSLWLLLRAFASGCTAMTGVEAVSNGVNAFADPAVKNAQKTLTAIVVILGLLLSGIAFLSHAYHIGAMNQSRPEYQSVISQLLTAVVGRGVFYYVAIGNVLAVLSLSANTSFAGFPRLGQLLALDDFLPHVFASLGRRLVYTAGILILAGLSAVLLIVFGGITDRLIPLFAVGAFGAFTLSQAGMVVHWKRHPGPKTGVSRAVNAVGAVSTSIALVIILVANFREGAWITLLLIPALFALCTHIKRHYGQVADLICCPRPLDLSHNDAPIVVVPIEGWNMLTEKALRFGMRLSPDVIAVHVRLEEEDDRPLRAQWAREVEQPICKAGLPVPRLEIRASPYRRLFKPLLTLVYQLEQEHPDRQIAVIVPELVGTHWYDYVMHNQRATGLKAALLMHGNQRIVMINVPWYMHAKVVSEQAQENQAGNQVCHGGLTPD